MCSICGYSTCPAGCPNADDPPAVYNCEICGESIVVGDEYVDLDGEKFHRECFEDLDTGELMEYIGGSIRTANEDDIDDGSDDEYERMRDERLFGN